MVAMATQNWHSQDWLLVLIALVHFAGPDTDTLLDVRVWELVVEIAESIGLSPVEAVIQFDPEFYKSEL